jgi:hypothetical protein
MNATNRDHHITIIGGGLADLHAAIAEAEAGAGDLLEQASRRIRVWERAQ